MPPTIDAIRAEEPLVYHLPDTLYYRDQEPTMALDEFANYAESERRNRDLGHILLRSLVVPLHGRLFYSPGGAAVVERAREIGNTDAATGKWHRAVIASPGTAVLGLGAVAENDAGVLMAGAAGPIMIGKSAYFLWTAGVNAEPITIETPFQYAEIEMIIEAMANEGLNLLEASGIRLNPKQKRYLASKLLHGVEKKYFSSVRDNADPFWKKKEVSFSKKERKILAEFTASYIIEHLRTRGSDPAMPADFEKILAQSVEDLNGHLRARIFAETVRKLANNYGFINIEDARGADLPLILGMLESMNLQSAIWSDDKQGTGVITAAGVLSWAEQTGRMKQGPKPLEGIRAIIFGAGAGAMGVYDELVNHGVRPEDILVTDTGPDKDRTGKPYVLHEERDDVLGDPFKKKMRQGIKAGTTVEEFAEGADLVINLGDVKTVTKRRPWLEENITRKLAAKPMMAYMTNPQPGIKPEDLHETREDAYYASGNQLYENTVNNFTAFGYIGLGALLAGATTINNEMTVAAAWAIHRVAKLGPTEGKLKAIKPEDREKQKEYGQHWIVPDPTDLRLLEEQTVAVALAAARSGVSIYLGKDPTQAALDEFEAFVKEEVKLRVTHVKEMREKSFEEAHKYYSERFADRYAPFYLGDEKHPVYYICPKIKMAELLDLAGEIGIKPGRLDPYLVEGRLNPKAMTLIFNKLKAATEDSAIEETMRKIALKELHIIRDISLVSPTLGLILALRRLQAWDYPDNLLQRPSVFHKGGVEGAIGRLVPKALLTIEKFKSEVERLRGPAGGGGGTGTPLGSPPVGPAPVAPPAAPAAGGRSASGRVRLTGGRPAGIQLVSSSDEPVEDNPPRQRPPVRRPASARSHGLWAPGALPRPSQVPVFIAH